MAKKKIKKSINSAKQKEVSKRGQDDGCESEGFEISAETKRGIVVVVLFLLGIVLSLAFFGAAGPIGNGLAVTMTLLFGWGDFMVPLLLLGFGYVVLLPHKYKIREINYIGLLLGVLGFYGFLHALVGSENIFSSISLGRGGGYVGLLLSWPLVQIFGTVASGVITFSFFMIGVFLGFNTSFEILYRKGNIFSRIYLALRNQIIHHKYSAEGEVYEGVEDGSAEGDTNTPFSQGEDIEVESEGVPGLEHEDTGGGEQEELIQIPKRRTPKISLPVEILSDKIGKPTSGDINANQKVIIHTLENFGIDIEMSDVNVGPTVTQYTFRPATGVKLSRITTLHNDIALALAAHPIRIEAPIPGKSLVGIEVPNKTTAIVSLKELINSTEFKKRESHLTLTLGKDVAGKIYLADLKKMPHLLIAGTTGSGKSVAINSILIGLMYQNQPSDLKFILVDPKRVELTGYADIPYLLTPVITEVKKTVNTLKWAVGEMERRLTVLSHSGKRNIESYNKVIDEALKMPYIVIVIDELADLMTTSSAEVEGSIVRLAQMARAVGIHLIVATQRPSVDVITGLIKANIVSRLAFSVPSSVDSRTILDVAGAEKLLGHGDMLFISAEVSKPKRLQGAFVSDNEIENFTEFLRGKAKPDYRDIDLRSSSMGDSEEGEDADELLGEAKDIIKEAGKASASLLQRRLRIGYSRAARILDILEDLGYVGSSEGAKPREIYIDRFIEKSESKEDEDEDGGKEEDSKKNSFEEQVESDDDNDDKDIDSSIDDDEDGEEKK